jgi:hypothetical protein
LKLKFQVENFLCSHFKKWHIIASLELGEKGKKDQEHFD